MVSAVWSNRYSTQTPEAIACTKQQSWDEASVRHDLEIIESHCADDVGQACFLAARAPHSGDWIHAMPISSCGLRLDDEAIGVAIGLRLGMNLCAPHLCPCGSLVDARGIYGLCCKRSAGRTVRHISGGSRGGPIRPCPPPFNLVIEFAPPPLKKIKMVLKNVLNIHTLIMMINFTYIIQ